ncbi:MAG: hypothetical protein JJ884_02305 [Maricaulis sp.]|jgi:hypothetical protein|uniref:hypothetical protein n=1 Tax=Maricaulis sp. TaxID=1486257 RepID=UPI001B293296|nr:hypothetical protein [Maricaulis sp.]MBO6730452.1 hypothetical protein [Maricaulis sp.]MBO6846331.1 hypothetical protein [Maricaulis sp.]MBO6875792.1 hypothetical protein [Maricaulis sp.]
MMRMFSRKPQPAIKELQDVPQCSIGAPLPIVLAEEHHLALVYLAESFERDWDGVPRLVGLDTGREAAITIRFQRPRLHKLGPPNEEGISTHPLARHGLQAHGAFEAYNTELLQKVARMTAHRHFVFSFRDSTLEVIAKDYSVEKTDNTSVLAAAGAVLDSWSESQ